MPQVVQLFQVFEQDLSMSTTADLASVHRGLAVDLLPLSDQQDASLGVKMSREVPRSEINRPENPWRHLSLRAHRAIAVQSSVQDPICPILYEGDRTVLGIFDHAPIRLIL